MPETPEVSETSETKALTSEEMKAFVEGLDFYLSSDLPEEEKLAFALKIVQDNLAKSESINQQGS
ncbi:hypothetical protein [Microcoleus sp. herbarium14]|uniref:hypothetical protein n=1 Tax=Microcoleus sp. herbarium14 TaxID=3055439 RepID=UPI002FD265F6